MEVSALLICQDATIPFCRKSKGLRYAQVPERSKGETRAELDLFLPLRVLILLLAWSKKEEGQVRAS